MECDTEESQAPYIIRPSEASEDQWQGLGLPATSPTGETQMGETPGTGGAVSCGGWLTRDIAIWTTTMGFPKKNDLRMCGFLEFYRYVDLSCRESTGIYLWK